MYFWPRMQQSHCAANYVCVDPEHMLCNCSTMLWGFQYNLTGNWVVQQSGAAYFPTKGKKRKREHFGFANEDRQSFFLEAALGRHRIKDCPSVSYL